MPQGVDDRPYAKQERRQKYQNVHFSGPPLAQESRKKLSAPDTLSTWCKTAPDRGVANDSYWRAIESATCGFVLARYCDRRATRSALNDGRRARAEDTRLPFAFVVVLHHATCCAGGDAVLIRRAGGGIARAAVSLRPVCWHSFRGGRTALDSRPDLVCL